MVGSLIVAGMPPGVHNGQTAYQPGSVYEFRIQWGDLVLERSGSVPFFDGSRGAVKGIEGDCPSCHLRLGNDSRTGLHWRDTIHNVAVSQKRALYLAHQG